MASMFSGLMSQASNQAAGLMNKVKGGDAAAEGAAEGEVPVEATAAAQENGEEVAVEGGEQAAGAGGVSGLAQGLMMKAMSAKDAIKEKGQGFQAPNLAQLGGMMQNVQSLIPGRKEEDVPTPPEPNPPTEIGELEEQVPE